VLDEDVDLTGLRLPSGDVTLAAGENRLFGERTKGRDERVIKVLFEQIAAVIAPALVTSVTAARSVASRKSSCMAKQLKTATAAPSVSEMLS